MIITQRALNKLGDLIELEEERIRDEHKDKPEWVAQELINELWDAHDFLDTARDLLKEDDEDS